MTTIGFYAHHVGRGHLDRVAAISAHLGAARATVASSHPELDALREVGCDVQHLPDDEVEGAPRDRSAGGRLHHAPLGVAVAAPRVRALVDWVDRERPDLVVVDVSTEVLLTVRLAGVPVVAVRLHGDRTDPAHMLAFDLAASVVAPYPAILEDPATPAPVLSRTFHAGLVHPPAPSPTSTDRRPGPPRDGGGVLVVWGQGSPPPSAGDLDAAARATPGWHWTFVGPPTPGGRPTLVDHAGWVPDLVARIRHADVVVGPCGDGAVAAVVAGSGRFLALPQPRPFAEQQRKAEALARCGAATVLPTWPDPRRWAGLLDEAAARPPMDTGLLGPDGALRLATHLLELAADLSPTPVAV